MPEQAINIRIKLTDEVSKNLKTVGNNLEQLGKQTRQLGRNIQQIGSTLTMAGGAITAPLILAFRKTAQYSAEVSNEIGRLESVFNNLTVSIGTALLPVIKQFTNALNGILALWNNLTPSTQQAIIQFTFLAGAILTIGGSLIFIIGKFVALKGTILTVVGELINFIATATGLSTVLVVGVGAALIAIIYLMFRFQEVGNAVMNALEIAIKTLSIGFWEFIQGAARGIAFLIGLVEKLFEMLAKMPDWLGGKAFAGIEEKISSLRENIDEFISDIEGAQAAMGQEIMTIMDTGKGQWSGWLDDMRNKIQEFFRIFKEGTNKSVNDLYKWGDVIKKGVQDIAQQMTDALSTFFFDVITGEMKNLQEYFANFGRAILQIITQIIAQWMVVTMLKKIGLGFMLMHQGGIVRAHSGYLARDEVPIIAQAGEGVLSRRGVQALGASNLARLNRGQSVGGGQIINQPVVVIQAWDTTDLMRNRKSIEAIIGNALRTNSDLRMEIKRYG